MAVQTNMSLVSRHTWRPGKILAAAYRLSRKKRHLFILRAQNAKKWRNVCRWQCTCRMWINVTTMTTIHTFLSAEVVLFSWHHQYQHGSVKMKAFLTKPTFSSSPARVLITDNNCGTMPISFTLILQTVISAQLFLKFFLIRHCANVVIGHWTMTKCPHGQPWMMNHIVGSSAMDDESHCRVISHGR